MEELQDARKIAVLKSPIAIVGREFGVQPHHPDVPDRHEERHRRDVGQAQVPVLRIAREKRLPDFLVFRDNPATVVVQGPAKHGDVVRSPAEAAAVEVKEGQPCPVEVRVLRVQIAVAEAPVETIRGKPLDAGTKERHTSTSR